MKLNSIIESAGVQDILTAVYAGVTDGNSDISRPLSTGEINLPGIIKAIKTRRCLGTSACDFGSTYLEQIIGGVINDRLPIEDINTARKLFGLEPEDTQKLVKRRLKKKLKDRNQQQPTQ